MNPTIVFRADASLDMGTGHVMRCLTLADSLKEKGAVCHFICREHKGNLIEYIRNKGFFVHVLPMSQEKYISDINCLAHAPWLGASQIEDAEQCSVILQELDVTWMIVDHYALDENWEQSLKASYKQLMVIDDLADRKHQCDFLLDQTFGRSKDDYRLLVESSCTLLCGSEYALLRPEFSEFRNYSLQRRGNPELRKVLVTLGGGDKDNMTAQILEALQCCDLPKNCEITVIMGATAPWLNNVVILANSLPWKTVVKIGVPNMAELMANSDLCIGAAGATSWERCCLGVPSLMVVLAENQKEIALNLEKERAVLVLDDPMQLKDIITELHSECLLSMGLAAAAITNGEGASKVIQYLEI